MMCEPIRTDSKESDGTKNVRSGWMTVRLVFLEILEQMKNLAKNVDLPG